MNQQCDLFGRPISCRRRLEPALMTYLREYRSDRGLTFTAEAQRQVDRLYQRDAGRIGKWSAHWHQRSATPYLFKKGRFIFLPETEQQLVQRIRSEHHVH